MSPSVSSPPQPQELLTSLITHSTEVPRCSIALTPPEIWVSHWAHGQAALTFSPSVPQALHLGELAQQAAVVSLGNTKGGHVTRQPSGGGSGSRNGPRGNLEQGEDPVMGG